MDTLFVYGTLQYPHLLHRLLGHLPRHFPAVLENYQRRRVDNESFPGIFPQSGAHTPGRLLFPLSHADFQHLDLYESDMYERREVRVRRVDGALCSAYAYVIPPHHLHLLSTEPWAPQPPTPPNSHV